MSDSDFNDHVDRIQELNDLLEEQFQRRRKTYRRHILRQLEDFNDDEFKRRYRLSRRTVDIIHARMRARLIRLDQRGLPIPPLAQILIALRFYAIGCTQLVCADLGGISQSTVNRIVLRISNHLCEMFPAYVRFPSTDDQLRTSKNQFYGIAGFPGVVGCIDGTHIPIRSPGGRYAEVFRNRKGRFSINVQAVGGPNLEFQDLVVRYPGSWHDSRVLDNSAVGVRFENRTIDGVLLGDSGYPLRSYLMTPFLNPQNAAEERFNKAHIKTRCTVERAFGLWKKRFPCLRNQLTLSLHNTVKVVCATAVLHNMCIKEREEEPNEDSSSEDEDNNDRPRLEGNASGNVMRQRILLSHFHD